MIKKNLQNKHNMQKKQNKILLLSLIMLFLVISLLSAFNWPQLIETNQDISTYFGQPRGSAFSNSIVFENPSEVKPAEDGYLLINLKTGIADMGWYENTLGNAVILAHENDLLTVYGNLEEIIIPESQESTIITKSQNLGYSGSTGWQKGKNSLEFQIIDTKSSKVINPFILMPSLQAKTDLVIKDFVAVNNSGKEIPISNYSKLNSGVYNLFIQKQPSGTTYKTSVYVNGAVVENIIYDVLSSSENRLTVLGKENYFFDEIYKNNEKQFLAEVVLPRGRNQITITIEDFFGNQKTTTYTIEVI